MIKKKLNIYLLLLLALLFTNLLSTTCYARELTATQIKNFMLNYIDNFYEGETYYQTYRQRIINMDISGWVNGISGKQGTYLLSATGNGQYLYFYYFCWRPTNNNYAYISTQNGYPIIKTYDTSIQFRNRFDVFNNTLGYDNANLFLANADGNLFNYYYIDGNIYSNSNKTEITYPAGTYYPNETIFDSQYIPTPSQHFAYAASVLQSRDLNLNGSYNFSETAQEILFDYNPFSGNEINQADSVITGYLWDADLFSKAIFTEYSYNYATGKFEYDGKYWESNDIGDIHDNMIWVEFFAKDYGTLYKPDTILHAEFQCNTTDFDFVHADFYIRSPHSVIRNQVLYPGETFSGDYAIINNDNKNTDKVINSLEDTYNKWFTVSGDQMQAIIDQTMNQIQIPSGELAEMNIILEYLGRQPGDFVISWNASTSHFSIADTPLEKQLTIPANQINFSLMERENETFGQVMYWERIIVNIGIFSLIVHETYILLLSTLGVGVGIYGMKQEEKATLKAQQQREADLQRRQVFNANQERLREYERLARKNGWKK